MIFNPVCLAYDGRYCENDANGCADVECFNEVQCYDAVAPESGAVCGACPGGYEGDGVKCTGKYYNNVHGLTDDALPQCPLQRCGRMQSNQRLWTNLCQHTG